MTTVNQAGAIQAAAQNTAVAKKPKTLKDYVQQMEGQFARALPKVITPERFTRIALSALSSNPRLMDCDRASFFGALMNSAQLGLEPNTPLGQAYLIPFRNNKKGITECQFQIGYKGLLDLAYRSGDISMIQSYIVYENDEFEYELGLEPILKHKPAMENRGDMICAYAMFQTKNGGKSFVVMSKDDILKYARKYSKTFNAGPWQTDFEAMAKKTVLKQLLKYAPIRSDYITDAEIKDEKTTIYDDASDSLSYVDDETGEVKPMMNLTEQAEGEQSDNA